MNKTKRVCVIGGAGYIGSRLVPALIERGYTPVVVDTLWFGNYLPPSVELVQQDVLTLPATFFEGFDAVLFLAGLASDPMAEFSPALNFIHNVSAPAYAAFAARRAGVPRFIYADSCSVYGNTGGRECVETDPPTSVYPYGVSKAQGNIAVMQLAAPEFSVIALRKGTLSGASPRMRFDLLINTFYKFARTEGKITVNNPTIRRPLLPMEDIIEAYFCALEAPDALSGTYNIASGNHTIGEIADAVQAYFKKVHGKDIAIETRHLPDVRDYKADISKAQKELGFKPKGSIESVLRELDANYASLTDFTDERYYNIRVFEKLLAKQAPPA